MLLDRTHDMIGSVNPITSEDMSATEDITATVHVLDSLNRLRLIFLNGRLGTLIMSKDTASRCR